MNINIASADTRVFNGMPLSNTNDLYWHQNYKVYLSIHCTGHPQAPQVSLLLLQAYWQWIKFIGFPLLNSWASYQIRKIAGCACAGNAGNVFPRRRFRRKPLVSDPDMHHGTCVTHVPWCMSGSLTCGNGENVPGIPGACAPGILRIWQEAHWRWPAVAD